MILIIATFLFIVHSQTLLVSDFTANSFSHEFNVSVETTNQLMYNNWYLNNLDLAYMIRSSLARIVTVSVTTTNPVSSRQERYMDIAQTAIDGKKVLGLENFSVLTTMVYTVNVPVHYRIRIQLSIYFQGNWTGSYIGLKLDNKILGTFNSFEINVSDYQTVDLQMLHSNPSLTIYLSQYNNNYQVFYGIRDFYLYYYPCPVGCNFCTEQNKCSDWILQISNFMPISTDQLTDSGWSLTGTILSYIYSQCSGIGLKTIGQGQGIYKQLLLPPHFSMRLMYTIIKVDNSFQQSLYLYVDNILYDRFASTENPRFQRSFCGSVYMDDLVKKDLIFQHSKQLTTIAINTTLTDSVLSYYGIREFQLFLLKCDPSCKACTGPLASDCIDNDNFLQIQSTITDLTSNTFTTHGWSYLRYPDSTSRVILYNSGLSIMQADSTQATVKTFTLPTHLRIKVIASLYSGGASGCSTTAVGNVQFLVDNVLAESYKASSICTNSQISFKYDHTRSYVQITVQTSGYTAGLNVGFREFILYYGTCASGCTTCTDSGDCVTNWTLFDYEFFTNIFSGNNGWTGGRYSIGQVPVTTCNSVALVGGLSYTNIYVVVYKTFTFIAHKMLRITMDLYFIGGWQDQNFYINIDGKQVYQQKSIYVNQNMQICSLQGAIVQVDFFLNHSATTSIFELYAYIDQTTDNKAWAFRNLIIYQI